MRKNPGSLTKPFDHLFNMIYNLSVVWGYESLVKLFPHDVADLELIVNLNEKLELEIHQWYVWYVLYEWLAIVVMVPFDLDTIDTKEDNDLTLL